MRLIAGLFGARTTSRQGHVSPRPTLSKIPPVVVEGVGMGRVVHARPPYQVGNAIPNPPHTLNGCISTSTVDFRGV